MAILTTNISNVSLTVSGNTTQTATISWSCPTVPAGNTITSCTLTGKATASMSKGNATIKVNGTTVSSGSNFTINLGTGNTTSSVSATAVGGNKNASGTVSFSNLVYTVEYAMPLPKYIVTFKDWDGTILKTEEVEEGKSATAPSNLSREGYEFVGWDKTFSNITSDLTVTAQYELYVGLTIKKNNKWTNINKVYKKINGVWVEESKNDWYNLFNSNIKYQQNPATPTAILYSDGALVFYDNHYSIEENIHGSIVKTYTDWESKAFGPMPGYAYDETKIWGYWFDDKDMIQKVYFYPTTAIKTSSWFFECNSLTSIDLSNFDASNVIKASGMFYQCTNLTSLNLDKFNTSNVTDMSYMFYGCSKLLSLNLNHFDTSNVTDMSNMFYGNTSLTSLALNNFNTAYVTNMGGMFSYCFKLTLLDLSSFDITNATKTGGMFTQCTNLRTIYVKDETAKTKIESSTGFPTTATVVIGSPN